MKVYEMSEEQRKLYIKNKARKTVYNKLNNKYKMIRGSKDGEK